ncbi:MAG: DMT family transporter [Verrucomicrobiae bacterium]|nr:DMT family transporter [Verrucomicrobiae bacterium]
MKLPRAAPGTDAISPPHLAGLIVGATCIAFAPIFAVLSGGPGGVGMWDAAFWRVFFGAGAMGLMMAVTDRRNPAGGAVLSRREGDGRYWGWLWAPGMFFAGDFWVWHWSFEHTSVANSTLLANVAILYVTLFAWLVWRERLSRPFVAGALLAFGGVTALLLSSKNRVPPTDGNPVFGDFLALMTAFFYGSYQLTMKRYRRERSAPVLMFWASAVAAALLLPLAAIHRDPFLPATAKGWWPLLALGVISHACGQGSIAYGLGGVPSSLASVTLLVQPLMTAALGAVILRQPLVPLQIAGGGAVIVGLFLAIRGQLALRTGDVRPAPAARERCR